MKNLIPKGGKTAFLVTAVVLQFVFAELFPQSENDYKSKASGNWYDVSSWLRYNGSAWVNATSPPDYNAGLIRILPGHTIEYNSSDISVNQLVIETGAQLTVNSGLALSTTDGDGDEITVYGTLYYTGTVSSSMPGTGVIKSGGTVIYYSVSNPAVLLNFFSVKEAGSNWVYQGSSTTVTLVSLNGRTYRNLSFESLAGTYNVNFQGTSPLVVDGNFSVGSGVSVSVTNTAENQFKGNYTVNGNMVFSTGVQTFTFCGSSEQVLTGVPALNFENINVAVGSLVKLNSNINVSASMNVSGSLDCADKTAGCSGAFSLLSGASLKTASANGLNGSVVCASCVFAPDAGLEFNGSSPQVTGTRLTSCGVLKINNSAGLTLSSSVSVLTSLNFITGKISAGNFNIVLGSSAAVSGANLNSYVVTNGTGSLKKLNMPAGADNIFPVGNASYTPAVINYTGTVCDFSVRTADTLDFRTSTQNFVKKKWVVSENASGGITASLVLGWNQADQNAGFNPAGNVFIGRYDGSLCTETSAFVSGSGPYSASANGFTLPGEFAVGNESTLPAEIISFVSEVRANTVTLRWKTSSENNNAGFYVERRKAYSSEWLPLGFVQPRGNSSGIRTYSFADEVAEGGVYSYRLKQTDYNGSFTYYYMKDYCLVKSPQKFRLTGNYPNPFNSGFYVNYEIPENCSVVFNFFEVTGRMIKEAYFREYAGYSKRYFDFSGFASGIYIYYVKALLAGGIMSAVGKCVLIK
ncbi:MAG: hypothetical protein LWX07_11870 [Bacteroidetes bacterium]|nr:hypothetical protein [Bacteroidota bacterium]